MMPDAFQRKQESTYYGSVEASDYGLIHSRKCQRMDKRVLYMIAFELTWDFFEHFISVEIERNI